MKFQRFFCFGGHRTAEVSGEPKNSKSSKGKGELFGFNSQTWVDSKDNQKAQKAADYILGKDRGGEDE